jgi:hypothetical protein
MSRPEADLGPSSETQREPDKGYGAKGPDKLGHESNSYITQGTRTRCKGDKDV